MRSTGPWLRLLAGLGGLFVLAYLLAAVAPAPRVVAEAEERGIHVAATFWTEIEDMEVYDVGRGERPDVEGGGR